MPSLGSADILCPVARLITNLRGEGGVGQLLLVHNPQPGFDQILALNLHKSPDQANKRGSFWRYRQLVHSVWIFPIQMKLNRKFWFLLLGGQYLVHVLILGNKYHFRCKNIIFGSRKGTLGTKIKIWSEVAMCLVHKLNRMCLWKKSISQLEFISLCETLSQRETFMMCYILLNIQTKNTNEHQ